MAVVNDKEMSEEHERHLHYIKERISHLLTARYRQGQAQHGGRLWEDRNVFSDALEEVVDLVSYMITLETKLESARAALNSAHEGLITQEEAVAIARTALR